MDEVHGGLPVHVLTGLDSGMDNVVRLLVAVVDGDVSGQCAGLDEVPFRFGQSVFPAILL